MLKVHDKINNDLSFCLKDNQVAALVILVHALFKKVFFIQTVEERSFLVGAGIFAFTLSLGTMYFVHLPQFFLGSIMFMASV